MKVSFIEPEASKTRISSEFGNSPMAYGSSQTEDKNKIEKNYFFFQNNNRMDST